MISNSNGVFGLLCGFMEMSFRIRPSIPTLKDTEPLLELDRDERKFDIFLTFHRSSLLVSDLKIFLPFTINLDPYLKKVIKGKISVIFVSSKCFIQMSFLKIVQFYDTVLSRNLILKFV